MSGELERTDPKSVWNLMPELLARKARELPQEFLESTEEELADMMPRRRFNEIEHRLRHTFWQEYDRASSNLVPMQISNIVKGVTTRETFLNRIMLDPVRLAFIMHPPTDYRVSLEETLGTLTKKLRQIADLPVYGDDGKPQYKNIELILKTFPHVDNRVKGGFLQRIESKNVTVSVNGSVGMPETAEDIDRRLRELEKRAGEPKVLEADSVRIGVIDVPVGGLDGEENDS